MWLQEGRKPIVRLYIAWPLKMDGYYSVAWSIKELSFTNIVHSEVCASGNASCCPQKKLWKQPWLKIRETIIMMNDWGNIANRALSEDRVIGKGRKELCKSPQWDIRGQCQECAKAKKMIAIRRLNVGLHRAQTAWCNCLPLELSVLLVIITIQLDFLNKPYWLQVSDSSKALISSASPVRTEPSGLRWHHWRIEP